MNIVGSTDILQCEQTKKRVFFLFSILTSGVKSFGSSSLPLGAQLNYQSWPPVPVLTRLSLKFDKMKTIRAAPALVATPSEFCCLHCRSLFWVGPLTDSREPVDACLEPARVATLPLTSRAVHVAKYFSLAGGWVSTSAAVSLAAQWTGRRRPLLMSQRVQ